MTLTRRRCAASVAADDVPGPFALSGFARTGELGAPSSSRLPQLPQKRAFGSLAVPQLGQARDNAAPHWRQKRRSARFSVPHEAQIICGTLREKRLGRQMPDGVGAQSLASCPHRVYSARPNGNPERHEKGGQRE
jgi:hypothetical protein